ncbi:MAG: transglutaminase-like domain-containing protein [Planctomycetota bacterium]
MTLALVALSSLLLQIALVGRQSVTWPGWLQLAVAAAVAVAAAYFSRRSPWRYVLAISTLVVLAIVWDAATRALLGLGDPYEVQLAFTLRNLMLGLVASRHELRTQHFAGLASFFLVLFSFLWAMNTATALLLVAYALVGMWWLLGCYWDGIQGRFADKTEQAIPIRPAGAAIAIVILLLLAALPVARSSKVTTALSGFFPSSGGTRWADDFAQGGVGDGNLMIAAKDDANSFGAVESELFIESKMPSLYDVYNELSETTKPNKKRGRMRAIPLAPTAMKQNHSRLGQNQQANREFNTVRNRPPQPRKALRDYKSPALLQVRGRVPLHLGLYTYDLWDGHSLGSSGNADLVARELEVDSADGRSWLRLSCFFPEPLFDRTEQHQVRVINLKTARVPSPPNLTAVHLDQLNDARFFRSAPDGQLEIDAAAIPQLTVLNVESRRMPRRSEPDLRRSEPAPPSDRLAALAAEWTNGAEPGWAQVAAIRDRLRRDYRLDPAAMAPQDCDDAVEHFLFEAKRGPDYLFATSAALLARSLGYEARVCSGLYAHPDNFDRLADLTSIYQEDAHFWVEVFTTAGMAFTPDGQSRAGSWVTLEPSPGYDVLYSPETLFAQVRNSVAQALQAAADHPLATVLVVATLAAVGWFRVTLLDHLVTFWWRVACRLGDARHQVLATVRLLERRAWLQSRPRGRGTTIGRWQLEGAAAPPESATAIAEFRRLASWALYGGDAPATVPAESIHASCRDAARLALRTRPQRITRAD